MKRSNWIVPALPDRLTAKTGTAIQTVASEQLSSLEPSGWWALRLMTRLVSWPERAPDRQPGMHEATRRVPFGLAVGNWTDATEVAIGQNSAVTVVSSVEVNWPNQQDSRKTVGNHWTPDKLADTLQHFHHCRANWPSHSYWAMANIGKRSSSCCLGTKPSGEYCTDAAGSA